MRPNVPINISYQGIAVPAEQSEAATQFALFTRPFVLVPVVQRLAAPFGPLAISATPQAVFIPSSATAMPSTE